MKFDATFFKKLYGCDKRITLATLFTLMRILLAPVIVGSLYCGYIGLAGVLFIVAALTDTIDGNLARYYNDKTVLGACLDPIADKILLVSTFGALAFIPSPLWAVPTWFVGLILCKELLIVLGTVYLLGATQSFIISPTYFSKATTAIQISFIVWLFCCYFFGWVPAKTYSAMMIIMVGCILVSFVQYVWIGLRYFLSMVVDVGS